MAKIHRNRTQHHKRRKAMYSDCKLRLNYGTHVGTERHPCHKYTYITLKYPDQTPCSNILVISFMRTDGIVWASEANTWYLLTNRGTAENYAKSREHLYHAPQVVNTATADACWVPTLSRRCSVSQTDSCILICAASHPRSCSMGNLIAASEDGKGLGS